MVRGNVATHSMARSKRRERICTITMVGTSNASTSSTVTTHSANEVPRPFHNVPRSAPKALPSPVKMAIHGARLHLPDSGCRMVKRNMETNGTNRNNNVTVRMMVLITRCLAIRAARNCGGILPSRRSCNVRDLIGAFTANVRPSFPRHD